MCHPMFKIGGAEIQTYLYAKEFARRGWKVFFLSKYNNPPKSQFDNKGIEVVLFKSSKIPLINWIKLLSNLIKIDADIYYNRSRQYDLFLFYLAKILNRSKYIWATMHDELCGKDAFGNKPNDSKKKGRKKIHSQIISQIQRFLFVTGVSKCNQIIVQNSAQKQTISTEFGQDSIVVYNSHPIVNKYNNSRKNTILFIAIFKPFKRVELFCQLANKLADKKYKFILIGENFADPKRKREMSKIIEQSNIQYLGFKSIEEINKILNNAKLLVNTSTFEGFSNTFIQAWMRGVPVISLKANPDNLLSKEKLGFICNDNLDKAAEKIEYLMKNERVWKEYSQRCYDFANENFNVEKTVEGLEKMFIELIKQREHCG